MEVDPTRMRIRRVIRGGGQVQDREVRRPLAQRPVLGTQTVLFRSLIGTGAHRNLASCGANQGSCKRRFDITLRAGGRQGPAGRIQADLT